MRTRSIKICSSCKKPFGTGKRCAWCGIRRKKYPLGSVFGSLLLIALFFLSTGRDKRQIDSKSEAIRSLTEASLQQRVHVVGEVDRYWSPAEGSRAPHKVLLRDASGVITIIYWKEVALTMPRTPRIGDRLHVAGVLQRYKNRLEIKVTRGSDLQFEE